MAYPRIRYDAEHGSAYVYLEKILPGSSVEQLVFGGVILDLGNDGRLLGIEILDPVITKAFWDRKAVLALRKLGIPVEHTGKGI